METPDKYLAVAEAMEGRRARRLFLQGVLRDTKKSKTRARRAGLKGTDLWRQCIATIRYLEEAIRSLA